MSWRLREDLHAENTEAGLRDIFARFYYKSESITIHFTITLQLYIHYTASNLISSFKLLHSLTASDGPAPLCIFLISFHIPGSNHCFSPPSAANDIPDVKYFNNRWHPQYLKANFTLPRHSNANPFENVIAIVITLLQH